MSAAENFPVSLVSPEVTSPSRQRFSLTSDILSFRRCRRQYGYFGNEGFVPAQAVQVYFGQMIHQVLDRCHRHYNGLYPGIPLGTFPTDQDIDNYYDEVDQALRAHGVRPASVHVATQAKQVLKTFNRVEGGGLYPRVIDTEYRLESDRNNFVLRGVVDVLVGEHDGDHEIWDYKGTDMPPLGSPSLRDYELQMSVYAELYKVKCGVYPSQAVLYFLNELKENRGAPPIHTRPRRAIHRVDFMRDGVEADGTPTLVKQGLEQFDITASDILSCKSNRQWDAPTGSDIPDDNTCDICDIRWNCPAHPQNKYPTRLPIV